jgi:hypothetical protein
MARQYAKVISASSSNFSFDMSMFFSDLQLQKAAEPTIIFE